MGRKRKIITGWRLIVLTLCAIAGFNVYDSRVINAAPLRGFYPASTSYVLSSWDFPRAWRSLLRNDAVIRMRKDWPRPYAPLELAARKKTGIRPTPSRWQLWMGKRIVFAESDEGFGITAYPGSLLRWADWVRNFAGAKPGNDGILQLGDTYYAWREGYLIASPARAYVVAAITTTDAPSPNSDNTALLTVQWMGQHPGFFHLRPGAGLPITGEVEFDARDGQRPLTLPQAWPKTPIASVTTRNSEDFAQLWRLASGWFDGSETLSELRHRAETLAKIWNVRALRPEWDTGADHVAIALFDVDTRGGIPLAEAALAMRYAEAAPQTSPFDGVLDASHVLPYEWNGCAGSMYPLLGIEFSPCVAQSSREWIASTNEAAMAGLAGRLREGPACAADVDVAVRVSWARFGEGADVVAAWLGENDLLPRLGEADVRGSLATRIKALSHLGELRIDGEARTNVIKFTGSLAESTGEEAE